MARITPNWDKVCYLCDDATSTEIATDVANWIDRLDDAGDDEFPDEEAREALQQWVEDNLTNCHGEAANFLEDGRVVVCADCFEAAPALRKDK